MATVYYFEAIYLNSNAFGLLYFRFLTNPSKDIDLRRWATEGLAFLTLDADVKEELINDTDALKSLIDVAAVSI